MEETIKGYFEKIESLLDNQDKIELIYETFGYYIFLAMEIRLEIIESLKKRLKLENDVYEVCVSFCNFLNSNLESLRKIKEEQFNDTIQADLL